MGWGLLMIVRSPNNGFRILPGNRHHLPSLDNSTNTCFFLCRWGQFDETMWQHLFGFVLGTMDTGRTGIEGFIFFGDHEASCMIMSVLRMNFRSLTNWRPVALPRRCPWRCGGFNGGDSLCRVIGPFSVMFRWRGLETHLARRWTYHPTSRRNIRRQLRYSGLGSLWVSVDIWPVVLVAVVLWWWLFNLAGIDLSARFILRKSGKENRNTGIPVYL